MRRISRILQVTRISNYGVASVVANLAGGLRRDLYEPVVLFDTPRTSYFTESLSSSGVKVLRLPQKPHRLAIRRSRSAGSQDSSIILAGEGLAGGGGPYAFLKAALRFSLEGLPRVRLFSRVIRENRIDLVHTHDDINRGKAEIIAARLAGVPCVAHSHNYARFTKFDLMFSRLVDRFVYISDDVARYHAACGKSESKGITIHNGIRIEEFAGPVQRESVLEEFGIPSSNRLVGMVGRIDWWKGHEYFLEAMSVVKKRLGEVKGLIIGELAKSNPARNAKYFETLQGMVKNLNLEGTVIFAGFRKDVQRILSALDVLVHASSRPEPFGLVVVEGMAAGRPVVATRAGGVPEIIRDGENGILVPCRDSGSIANAVIRLLGNPEEARRMGEKARERAAKQFSLRAQVEKIENLYEALLKR